MKKIYKSVLIILTTLTVITCYFVFDGYYRAPSRLKVRYQTITSNKIDDNFNSTSILVFSDLHYNQNNKKLLSNLIKTINEQNPDMIIFLGDLVDRDYIPSEAEINEIIDYFSQLKAKFAKLAIYGDEDGNKGIPQWLNNADFEIINNGNYKVSNGTNSYINLIGLYDNEVNLNNLDSNVFNVVLNHKPEIFSDILDYNFDYMLSAHTIGGQVNFFNLYSFNYKGPYLKGQYYENNKYLDVTSGVGTKGENIRIFADSEIVVYHLYRK